MRFVALIKFKKKPTKEIIAQSLKLIERETKEDGVKAIGIYWTLGRYDSIAILEAPDEKTAMRMAIRRGDIMSSETLVAIPAEEARKLVE
jgi:uncharacterized protein with GYD domain